MQHQQGLIVSECVRVVGPAGPRGRGQRRLQHVHQFAHVAFGGAALYRQRGTAEGHMGELMDVLEPALSSASRARGSDDTDAFAHNEALLVLHLLAYEVMHTGRCVMEKVTRTGWSLRRFRERVLKVGMRIVLHARRATLVIAETAAAYWQDLWRAHDRWPWNRA